MKTIKKGEIFDLDLEPIKRIRFIVTREADNPVLALFSGNEERVLKSYDLIEEQTDLTKGISKYYYTLKELSKKEVSNMYTDEDYARDYGFPEPGKPFLFPWEKEIIEKENMISEIRGQMKSFNKLHKEKKISEEVYQDNIKPLEKKLLEAQNQ